MMDFVTASHNATILDKNLLRSNLFADRKLIVQSGFDNISKAYNAAPITSNIVVYLHHDIFLPNNFFTQLQQSINTVTKLDKNWGVLGIAGVQLSNDERQIHGNILDRGKHWGCANDLPHEVDTLDELLLITHGDLIFDEQLPLHFYGADICMQAKQEGRKCYAIKAFCHHNSSLVPGYRSESFYECKNYFRNKWRSYLPIATTCTIVK
jgi:hypothetical protein